MATASSDRTIKVFQVEPGQSERLLTTLSGHQGPVWQVAWAHPKFGNLLASCSYDGSVIIWKEGAAQQQQFGHQPYGMQQQPQQSTWIKAKEHRVHESSVNSISWAPHEFGLMLACASSDGQVSVLTYKVEDSTWESKVFAAHQIGCNAVSWCASPSADYLAALTGGSPSVKAGEKRLVTGGCDNLAKVWCLKEDAWTLEASLDGHSDWVRDVAWAPNSNTIATCSQDKSVLIWKAEADGATWTKTPLSVQPFGDTVWRLSWSTAGNLLAVSCGDNTVSLWREAADGTWEQVSKADQASMN